jgi:small subunit ribosomal protein S20
LAKKSKSAEKRHRKSEERRLRNKSAKSAVRTSVKNFVTLAHKKDPQTEAALKEMIKKIDTAAGKGIIKKNTAARKKSRMQRFYNSIKTRSTAAK